MDAMQLIAIINIFIHKYFKDEESKKVLQQLALDLIPKAFEEFLTHFELLDPDLVSDDF